MPKDNHPASTIVKLNERGSVTIPEEFRAAWDMDDPLLEIALRDDGVIELRPRALIDRARLTQYEDAERRRDAFFEQWQAIAEEANVPPEEAEELAAEAVRAARQATRH
jgi:bifunctional DNA-binding transcriptional regulator/antitoxin component of YhaV-PrlF toxin-antitoxin module